MGRMAVVCRAFSLRCQKILFRCFVCFIFFGTAVFYLGLFELPDYKAIDSLPVTTVLFDVHGERIREYATTYREPIPLTKMGTFPEFVIAAEDRQFWKRWTAFDFVRMGHAVWIDLHTLSAKQGGSTITQQLAKQVFLPKEAQREQELLKVVPFDKGAYERAKLWRKMREAWVAICLEWHFSRSEILAMYMNAFPCGESRKGAQACSEFYFSKNSNELEPDQAALLAGLIRRPRLSSSLDSDGAKQLRARVLAQCVRVGLIDQKSLRVYDKRPLPVRRVREPYADYFAEMIRRKMTQSGRFVDQGYRIRTTLDLRFERVAQAALQKSIHAMQARNPALTDLMGSAFMIETGQGRSLFPGAIRVDAQYPEFKENEYDLVYQAERHTGSAFKPFFLAAWIEKGGRLTCEDEGTGPCMLGDTHSISVGMGRGKHRKYIQNFPYRGMPRYRGMIPVILATAESRNVAFMSGMEGVRGSATPPFMVNGKPERIYKEEILGCAERLGIPRPKVDPGLTLPIGSIDVSVSNMTRAWTGFMGGMVEPHAVEHIEYFEGASYRARFADPEPIFASATSLQLIRAMRAVVEFEHGTARAITKELGIQAMGKTGTATDASGETTDNWFVGCTPSYCMGVWIGRKNKSPIPVTRAPNGDEVQETGGRNALPVWIAVMREVYKNKPKETFPESTDPIVSTSHYEDAK